MKKGGRAISWKSETAVKKAAGPCSKKTLLTRKTNIEKKNVIFIRIKIICVNIIYNSDLIDMNIFIGYSLILRAP